MLIECPNCESNIDAKVLHQLNGFSEVNGVPDLYSFLQCPSCKEAIVSYQEMELVGPKSDDYEYSDPIRMWPKPRGYIHYSIPEIVRISLEEADKCLQAGAYSACAVMCGRAIEGICTEHKVKSKSLVGGLKELKDSGVIDSKLFLWSEALRKHRNLGAHATLQRISREDAKDLVDFAKAINEYVYVLTDKFNDFMSRTSAKTQKK